MRKLQNNKHTNKKSQFLCKYYVPIYKRVDTELEKRKAKLQKITEMVTQEREQKDKLKSDELYFPRTRLSYEVQQKRSYINDKYSHTEDLTSDAIPPCSSHQQFKNFLRDHQAWEYKKQKKIDK